MLKDLKANRASTLLHRMVAEGEHVKQDFKFTVNDARKIARSISAFANNSGGRLLIGVDDNGSLRGIRSEEDIYVVEAAGSIYCSPAVEANFTAYKEKGGAVIICAEIAKAVRRPVFVKEEKGLLQAYFRVADENIVAHPLMVRSWKYTDDPERLSVFEINADRTSVLSLLEKGTLTPEDIFRKVRMSRARAEETILELVSLDLLEFTYKNRQFYLSAK